MNYHIKFDVYESLKECQYFGCLRSNEKNSSAISVQNLQMLIFILMSVLRDLVPFAQFKCEKHPWRSVTFIKVAGFPTFGLNTEYLSLLSPNAGKSATLLKVTLLHGWFSRFLNCTNGNKS